MPRFVYREGSVAIVLARYDARIGAHHAVVFSALVMFLRLALSVSLGRVTGFTAVDLFIRQCLFPCLFRRRGRLSGLDALLIATGARLCGWILIDLRILVWRLVAYRVRPRAIDAVVAASCDETCDN
ncbi:hypothetical protein [Mesorhizobium sp. 43Arga]